MAIPEVSHIYCLKRFPTAAGRQATVHFERGLDIPMDPAPVTFLGCDLTCGDPGLDPVMYQELVQNAIDFVRNAWPVNFNQQFDSRAPSMIAGLRYLIDLAIKPSRSMRLLFVSSIGTIVRWKAARFTGPVPQVVHDDMNIVGAIGYSESKWMAKQLLAEAVDGPQGLRHRAC
jgi:thioester reductase-like protein